MSNITEPTEKSEPVKPSAPKPSSTKSAVESEVVLETIVEPTVAPDVLEEAPVVTNITAPPSPFHAVSPTGVDTISLGAAVYKNEYARKSLTVHHIQRRLLEWGFPEAYSDKDGYYGDPTKNCVTQFQNFLGLPPTGLMDMSTLVALFENDQNVSVVY